MLVAKGKLDCAPAEAGYDESREAVLINHFQKMIDRKEIQCASYCVSRKGKVILHGAVGPRSYEEGCQEALQADSVHHIASITKVFTAVAVMKLIEDGFARLDTCVGEILPQFATPPYDKITLFQLLTHTSGFEPDPNVYEDKYRVNPWDCIQIAYERCKNKEEFDWLAAGMSAGLNKEPGTEWRYSSFGFVILGAVIEKLSGQFAHTYIEENIVKPLQMKDTSFDPTKDMASRMIYKDEEHKKWFQDIVAGVKKDADENDKMWSKVPDTGGGLFSTAYDLTRFGNMMLGKGRLGDVRILGRKTVEKMTTYSLHNIPDNCWEAHEPDRQYGIGFDMRTGPAYHYSEGTFMHEGAGACSLVIDPKEEVVASWFVPFIGDNWYAQALYNVTNIIWSGIL